MPKGIEFFYKIKYQQQAENPIGSRREVEEIYTDGVIPFDKNWDLEKQNIKIYLRYTPVINYDGTLSEPEKPWIDFRFDLKREVIHSKMYNVQSLNQGYSEIIQRFYSGKQWCYVKIYNFYKPYDIDIELFINFHTKKALFNTYNNGKLAEQIRTDDENKVREYMGMSKYVWFHGKVYYGNMIKKWAGECR